MKEEPGAPGGPSSCEVRRFCRRSVFEARRRSSLLLLFGLAALGACARPDGGRPGTGADMSPVFLVGAWVLEEDSCESDNGVFYRPDGSWHADGVSGTWSAKRDIVTIHIVEEEDDRGRMKRLDPPPSYVERLEVVGPDEYVAWRQDGTARRFVRCRA